MGNLEDWVDGLVALLPYFKDSHWPEDVPYDFSRASLERLETLALQRYAGLEALGEALGEGEDRDGFLEGVLAYLGEAMRRLGGGSWRWDENKQPGIPEQPVVLFDERLGLPAMASFPPYFLLIEAISKRGGGTFARAYSELQGVVDAHRAEEPEWTPVQQPTTGLDEGDPDPADASSVVPEGSSGSGDVVPKAEHWVNAVNRILQRLKDVSLPDDFRFDFSPASLDQLEALAVQRYERAGAVGGDDQSDGFLPGVLAYVGEALLRVAGGFWIWHEAPGGDEQPVIVVDERLSLPALGMVVPYHLLIEAIDTPGVGAFARAHERLQRAVEIRQAEEPGWMPLKQPTPGLDGLVVKLSDQRSAVGTGLSEASEEGVDQTEEWVRRIPSCLFHLEKTLLPDDFPFDFSHASLERLGVLALQRYDDTDAIAEDDYQVFVDGVLAYVGESLLRLGGGSWIWNDDIETGMAEQPLVLLDQRFGRTAGTTVAPLFKLVEAVSRRDSGVFARAYVEMQELVDACRARDPGWTPVREPTPGLDPINSAPADYLGAVRTETHAPPDDVTDPLVDWVAGVWVRLDELKVLEFVPEDFPLDFSRASLERLEALVLQRYETQADVAADDDGGRFFGCVMAYLGEALLRMSGGCWGWDDEYGQPVVVPDEWPGMPAMWPQSRLIEAVEKRHGGVFTRVHSIFQARVDARRCWEPGWTPMKEPTPNLDTASPDLPAADRMDPLEEWLEFIDLHLDGLRMPEDFQADFSLASLEPYEAVLLQRYDDPRWVAHAGRSGWVTGDVAYVGETLLRVGGGCWSWDDDSGVPVVLPDERLGLPAISPSSLMIEAVRNRTGSVIAKAGSALLQRVDACRAEEPDWNPRQAPTGWLDSDGSDSAQGVDALHRWNESIDSHLDTLWRKVESEDFQPDFSLSSLEPFGAMVLRWYADPQALAYAHKHKWVDADVAYVGQALLRVGGGRWGWDDDSGAPIVEYDGRLGLPAVSPLSLLMEVVAERAAEVLVRAGSALQQRVEACQAEDPAWNPVRQPSAVDRIKLEGWLRGIRPRLENLRDVLLPDDFPFDFSPGSLQRLECFALDRYADPGDMFAAGEEAFVEGVATYLGEAALALAGGAWGWQEGQPVLHPDERLGLPPDWPQLQLLTAVANRDRQVFAGTLASLQQHVDALRAEDPDWTPVRQPAPAPDVIVPASSDHRDDVPTGFEPTGGDDIPTGGVAVPATGDDQLESWLKRAHLRPDRLTELSLPADFPLDFSTASLTRLEAFVLQRCDDPRDVAGAGEQDFVEAVVAYVGEALLRVGGGGWKWDEGRELPLVHLDERLSQPVVTPLFLMIEAVANGGGGAFARTHAALQEQVKTRRAEDPGWRPVKQPTPGLDLVEPGSEQADQLTAWLAERERVFPAWLATYAGDDTFDHTPESLEALEALVRRVVPTKEELDDPGNANFVDGAVWCLGEVMRGANGAEWCFQPGELDPWNPHIGRPYIQHPTDGGSTAVPILDLAFMLGKGVPGVLRERYAEFAR